LQQLQQLEEFKKLQLEAELKKLGGRKNNAI